MSDINFFTAVSYLKPETIEQKAIGNIDNYFHFYGRKAVVVNTSNGKEEVKITNTKFTALSLIKTIGVALSYFTIIIPLIMLISKAILRASHNYTIIDPKDNHQKSPKSSAVVCSIAQDVGLIHGDKNQSKKEPVVQQSPTSDQEESKIRPPSEGDLTEDDSVDQQRPSVQDEDNLSESETLDNFKNEQEFKVQSERVSKHLAEDPINSITKEEEFISANPTIEKNEALTFVRSMIDGLEILKLSHSNIENDFKMLNSSKIEDFEIINLSKSDINDGSGVPILKLSHSNIEDFVSIDNNNNNNVSTIQTDKLYDNYYQKGANLTIFDKMRSAFRTGRLWFQANLVLPYPLDADPIIAAAQKRLAKPGSMLFGSDVYQFIQGIAMNKPLNVIDSFYSFQGINNYTFDEIKKLINTQAENFVKDLPICIPVITVRQPKTIFEKLTAWDINHIVLIFIDKGIVEYYDSKGENSRNQNLKDNSNMRNVLEYCKTKFEAEKIVEHPITQQEDVNNCGVFVSRLIYKRMIEGEHIGTVRSNPRSISIDELNDFRMKIIEIAYPPVNQDMIQLFVNSDLDQVKKDLHRLGSLQFRDAQKVLQPIYENTKKKTSEEIYELLEQVIGNQYIERASLLAAQTVAADFTERVNIKGTDLYLATASEAENLDYTQVLTEMRENDAAWLKKMGKQKDKEINLFLVDCRGGKQHIIMEIDRTKNVLLYENKVAFRLNVRENGKPFGFMLVKRTISIPLNQLDKNNNMPVEPTVVDWYSELIKPTDSQMQKLKKSDAEKLLKTF